MAHDAQHRTIPAMPGEPAGAEVTPAASQVDLAHNPLSQEFGIVTGDHPSNEFMAWRAFEMIIATLQLQVGVTDSGQDELKKGIAWRAIGNNRLAHRYLTLFNRNG
jgi:hypothetical protein